MKQLLMILFLAYDIMAMIRWAYPLSAEDHGEGLLADCAARLLNAATNSSRPAGGTFITAGPAVQDDFLSTILQSAYRHHRPAVLLHHFHTQFFDLHRPARPNAYLIAARDASDLNEHLATVNVTNDTWQPSDAVFVALLKVRPENLSYRELKPVFNRMWHAYMLKSVLLVPSAEASDKRVDVVAWFPFEKGCGKYHKPKLVNECRRVPSGNTGVDHVELLYKGDATKTFENRVPDTFFKKNCIIKLAGFHWPPRVVLSPESGDLPKSMRSGLDVKLMYLMSRIGGVNLKLIVINMSQRWGIKSADGEWNGGLGVISNGEADILLCSSIMTIERSSMFLSVPTFQLLRFRVYAPLPQKLPFWQNMLNVFSPSFWIALMIIYCIISMLFWLSGEYLPSERSVFADPGHCFIITWSILCSVPVGGRHPLSRSSNTIFLAWVVYVMHISAVYTSLQLILLYKPIYDQPMQTISDVSRSGLTVSYVPTFLPIGQSMMKQNFNLTGYITYADMNTGVQRMLQKRDIVIVDPEQHFEQLKAGYWLKKVHTVEEPLIVYNLGIYMQKGSPYERITQKAVMIAYESGLFNKWMNDEKSLTQRTTEKTQITNKKLTINELQGAFMIHLFGNCLSMIAFVFERLLKLTRGSNID